MEITKMTGENTQNFGKEILAYLNEQGWDSFSKQDIKLLFFYLAQKYKFVSADKVTLDHAVSMKMSKRRLENALLESQIRFGEWKNDGIDILKRLLESSETKIEDLRDEKFVFNVRNPILREQVVDYLEQKKMTPDFKNNKSLMIVSFSSFMMLLKEASEKDSSTIESDILKSLYDNSNSEELLEYHKWFKDQENNNNPLTLWDAIIGFAKEKSVEKIGASLTKYIVQNIKNILI